MEYFIILNQQYMILAITYFFIQTYRGYNILTKIFGKLHRYKNFKLYTNFRTFFFTKFEYNDVFKVKTS